MTIPHWRRAAAASVLALGVLMACGPAAARRHHHHASSGDAAPDSVSDSASDSASAPGSAASFDYYLLSLSVAPSFCRLSPRNGSLPECQALSEGSYERTPLTLHGLWPNRANVSVNQQPHDCSGAGLGDLPGPLQDDLRRYMPGGARLEQHEWQTHGTCSGLEPAEYFGTAVKLAQAMDAAVGSQLRSRNAFGTPVRVSDLLAAVTARDPALGPALVVSCRTPRGGGPTLIEEIRVTLSRSFQPVPAGSVGLGQNSGCRDGTGLLPRVGA